MTEIQLMMVDTLQKLLLHLHVTLYTLCMGMNQQHVKDHQVGVTKHQLAMVMK